MRIQKGLHDLNSITRGTRSYDRFQYPWFTSIKIVGDVHSCLSFQSPVGSTSTIFAKLEVYLWLGLAKYSKEATMNLPDEFLPIFEEEEEEQKRVVTTRKLPISLSCQGE